MSSHRFVWRVLLGLVWVGAAACDAPGGPAGAKSWLDGGGPSQDGGTTPSTLACNPANGSEDLGPRVSVLNAIGMGPVAGGPRVIQVTEVFNRFNTLCGQCHVATGNGGKQTSANTFSTTFDGTWLSSIKSEDPAKAMPPEGKAFSSRADGDPVRQLVALLEPWLAQNRPADMFTIDDSTGTDVAGSSAAAGSYAYASMTNVGDCIAPAALYAQSPSDEMTSKDQLFASATSLPDNLSDTDLTTFDADTLTANGVVAFVPTYPLWSDGSGKLRHIRVPKGTSVKFDKATQTFTIPPNTRFYKTFFRKVTDSAGRSSNRKIETRVIVARPDTLEADGQTPHQNALFGTYVWSEDELTATLLTTPYRDGTPWADHGIPYVVNEIAYRGIVASLGPGSASTYSLRLQDAVRSRPDVLQHYAIPGRIRCVQCHQGSATRDFVLGFLPMQIARRANATGGTYEPTGADELTQLRRLIDYGVITGMDSPADVLPLEQSQPPRHPRTDQELAAQGYMVGNCMHCHNPRGYPSLVKPELSSALNFLPSTGPDGGGIFEFSLENYSPVRSRGANQDVKIPYITPSLRDFPVTDLDLMRLDDGNYIQEGDHGTTAKVEQTWTPKFSVADVPEIMKVKVGMEQPDWREYLCGGSKVSHDYCGKRKLGQPFVSAPWRSLIYRNVDTPFPYFDDYVPFPHMPMNTAGFDCRAPRIMGDWMVSIPATRKYPDISEDALPLAGHSTPNTSSYLPFDASEQPYREVLPTDPEYDLAQLGARNRLQEYHDDIRYNYCQDVLSPDIFDPILSAYDMLTPDFKLVDGQPTYHPDPARYIFGGQPPSDPQDPQRPVQPALGVPYHAHWFDYDPTDSPPPWKPRRGDAWQTVLVDHVPDAALPAGQMALTPPNSESPNAPNDIDNRRRVTSALSNATLTDELRSYATKPVAYGVWQDKPECKAKLAALPRVSDVLADAKAKGIAPPAWITAMPSLAQDAPVYQMSPGGALYRHICFNCHGPRADGKGLQGDALAASSEGQARPANFRDGLLGPRDNQGQNILNVFGGSDHNPGTARTMASRYVAWMALGGTLQQIPQDIIHQVEATKILGYSRPNLARALSDDSKVSANMLELAKGLCATILPNPNGAAFVVPRFRQGAVDGASAYPFIVAKEAPFVSATGDWEMWMNLCSRFNAPVVRVFAFKQDSGNANVFETELSALYYADPDETHAGFPKNAPVLDHNRAVQMGIDPATNYFPACLAPIDPSLPVPQSTLDFFAAATSVMPAGAGMPTCPPEFLNGGGRVLWRYDDNPDPELAAAQRDKIADWTLHGAINAGMSVFSYLSDPTVFDPDHPAPYYSDCQRLP